MEQIAGLARVLADRIGALFGVLDLSFFVAGGVTLLAFTFVVLGVDPHAGGTLAPSLVGAAAILLSYSCGLVSMSLGRLVRRRLVGPWRRAPPEASLGAALARQLCDLGLNTHPYFSPHFVGVELNDGRPPALTQRQVTRFVRLYAHLWAVLRQEKALAPSLEQLNALWVRSAVMDGLVAAFVVWAAAPWVILRVGDPHGPIYKALDQAGYEGIIGLSIVLLTGAGVLVQEAVRSERTLVEELVGTMAWHLQAGPPPTGGPS